jgi:hypothetical protein
MLALLAPKETPCDGALMQRGRRLTRILKLELGAAAGIDPFGRAADAPWWTGLAGRRV